VIQNGTDIVRDAEVAVSPIVDRQVPVINSAGTRPLVIARTYWLYHPKQTPWVSYDQPHERSTCDILRYLW
jgi:hypothetical protein